jgi:ABC-type amino acid transport system permease subunit
MAVVSVVILAMLTSAVVLGPFVWRVPINEIDFAVRLGVPSWEHPFGTDDLGQDLLARMLYGGRISLAVGFAAMAVAMIAGTVIGAIAGISRGSVDAVLMWITDLFLALPQLPLLLLVIYLFRDFLKNLVGPEGGVFILIVLVIGCFRWMPVARLVRAQFLSLREKEFVEAARALGATTPRLVIRHILRNHRGIDAVVPRPRLSAGYSDLGPSFVRCQGLSRHRAALGAVRRRRHFPDGAGDQFHRRRIARRARSQKSHLNVGREWCDGPRRQIRKRNPAARDQGAEDPFRHR